MEGVVGLTFPTDWTEKPETCMLNVAARTGGVKFKTRDI